MKPNFTLQPWKVDFITHAPLRQFSCLLFLIGLFAFGHVQAQTTLYSEDFSSNTGTIFCNSRMAITGGQLEGSNTINNCPGNADEARWTSDPFSLSGNSTIDISAYIEVDGDMEENQDPLRLGYIIDAGSIVWIDDAVQFQNGPDDELNPEGEDINNNSSINFAHTLSGISGTNMQIVVEMTTSTSSETWIFDDLLVQAPAPPIPPAPEDCSNGVDDDGDGLVDCLDPECEPCGLSLDCDDPERYFLPAMWGTGTDNPTRFTPQEIIFSTQFPSATVNVKTADGSYDTTFSISNGSSLLLAVPTTYLQTDNINTAEANKGFIISSDEPISATYRLTGELNQDVVTLKNSTALGYSFFTGSQTRLGNSSNSPADDERHFIGIMAAEDNTTVTVSSPIPLEGVAGSSPTVTFTLNQYETYVLTGQEFDELSISGALVTSDKPVAVISGSQHNPQPYNQNRDAGIDQLVPAHITGTDYIAVTSPNSGANSNYLVIVAADNGTDVTIDGTYITTLNAGQVFDYTLSGANTAYTINLSEQGYVYHVAAYGQYEYGMGILPPISECIGNTRLEFYRTPGTAEDQATVLIPTTGLASLTFRGAPYTTYGTATAVPGFPGYSFVIFEDNDIAPVGQPNLVTSNERFQVGVYSNTGGNATGNYGYYSNYAENIELLDPNSGLATNGYTIEVDPGVSVTHCLNLTSCGTSHTILNVTPGPLTQNVTFSGNCVTYTMDPAAGPCVTDQLTIEVENDQGFIDVFCIDFRSEDDISLSVTANGNPAVFCPGSSTTLTANATSTNGITAYEWTLPDNTTENTASIQASIAGTYTLEVTDGNGCTDETTYEVIENSNIPVTFNVTPISCFNANDGEITALPGGGVAPYTYSWTLDNNPLAATTATLTNLGAGTYAVTVTDFYGCTGTGSTSLTNPSALTTEIELTPLSCTEPIAFELNEVTVGGLAPFSYLWSTGETTPEITVTAAGTYSITVTDANGCTATDDIVVTSTDQMQLSGAVTDATCNPNGAIDLTVTHGNPPFTYSWTGPGGFTASTEDITNLAAGTYSVTVTDDFGCTATASFTVNEVPVVVSITASDEEICNGASVTLTASGASTYSWSTGATTAAITVSPTTTTTYSVTGTTVEGCTGTATQTITVNPNPTASTSVVDVACFGEATGSATVTPSGGTPGYTYQWDANTGNQTTAVASNLAAGTYSVTVTDSEGCTATATATVTQPAAALSASATGSALDCFGDSDGTVDLSVSGGTAPYTFSWSNGATTEDLSGLTASTYDVTVTDANGCEATASASVTQPAAPLSISGTPTAVLCFGESTGSIDITVSGGTLSYSYAWSNGATTEDISGLAAGDYTVTVTDGNGCTASETFTVTQPAAALSASATGSALDCFGDSDGTVDLSVSGGTAPYTFSWSNGATTEDLIGLTAGTYNVTVTDANGCEATANATVTQPAAPLSISGTPTAVLCFGESTGSIDITVSGGTLSYSYAWSNGATTEDISGLAAGDYTVTVTDGNGCTASETFTVTQPAAALSASATGSALDCFGDSDGTVDLSVSGGTAPYTFSWSNGATTEDLSGLTAGTYNVTVTDANGCEATANATVTQPAAPLSISGTPTAVLCFGESTGSIDITVSGGTLSYSYAWSNGATTEDISGLAAGDYTVTVTDGNGCTTSETFTVTQPAAALSASATGSALDCFGDSDGTVDLSVSGGTAPYTFSWSNGATTEDLSGLTAGTYNVTVTDANGCEATASASVTQPAAPLSISGTPTAVLCFGESTGSIDITVSGGTLSYSYAWSNGATTEDISGLAAGDYTVTVTDGNGCTESETFTVTQPAAALSASATGSALDCFGDSDGTVDLSVSGGTAAYTYNWDNGATTEDLSGLTAGTYNVTVTDANGCEATASASVTQPGSPLTVTCTGTNLTCTTATFGTATATPSGGTSPYTYQWNNGQTTQTATNLTTGTYIVTVTDANGCTEVCTTAVTVETDVTPPQISCPPTVSVQCDISEAPAYTTYTAFVLAGGSASDECGLDESSFELVSQSTDGASCPETITRVYRIADINGNTATCEHTIIVDDTESPIAPAAPADETYTCLTAVPAPGQLTATDNCSADITVTGVDSDNGGAGCAADPLIITRTWTFTDDCGNTSSVSQTITVIDDVAPVAPAAPADETYTCLTDVPAPGQLTATDNCSSDITVTGVDSDNGGAGCAADPLIITRTWTFTDDCGNTSSVSQTITVVDDVAPVAPAAPADETYTCLTDVPAPGQLTATDNCSADITVTGVDSDNGGAGCAADPLIITRTWTFTDDCGNTSSVSQTITVIDDVAPVAPAAPADETYTCLTDVPAPGQLTATDNCSADITVTGVDSDNGGAGCAADPLIITRTWTFTDDCGNTSSVSQTITVIDDVAPVAPAAPADETYTCLTDVPNPGQLTATDNCSADITVTGVDSDNGGAGCAADPLIITRTWTFTDDCGNTSSVSQTITVIDDVAPTAPAAPADETYTCLTDVPNPGQLTATDNCSADITVTGVDSDNGGAGCASDPLIITRTWTFTDDCGNTSSVSQTITVIDDVAPVAPAAPADETYTCLTDVPAPGQLTATDNCSADITVTGVDSDNGGAGCAADPLIITRTWTFTDDCGNTSSVSQTITVIDDVAPVAPAAPADETYTCLTDVPAPGQLTATDNCSADITVTGVDSDNGGAGCAADPLIITRTWTFTDDCGNTSSVSQTITVIDDVAPVAPAAPADETYTCLTDVPAPGQLTATDNCSADITVTGVDSDNGGAGCAADPLIITRTWTFTDDCGNTSSVSQTITVIDDVNPVLVGVPADITVNCDLPTVPTVTATDNCDTDVAVVYNQTSSIDPVTGIGTVTRTWTATDDCGNSTSVSQTITVNDTEDPVITCPADITISCEDDSSPANTGTATATDNCSTPTITSSDVVTPGTCADESTITRTWTATDAAGNTATCVQTITIVDDTDPTWDQTMPADVTVECDAVPAVPTNITASDNCDADVTVTFNEARTDGACADSYTLTRTWTAVDNCGNDIEHVQVITLEDTEAPTFDFVPADVTVECDAIPAVGTPTASDNCDADVTIVYNGENRIDGACADSYTLTRSWTATDNCDNSTTVTQTITVEDTQDPTWDQTMPADVTVECDAVPAVPTNITASDNCDADVTVTFNEARTDGACADSYTLTRTWTAVDNCGNDIEHVQVITVEDTEAPTFDFVPADVTVECDAIPAVGTPTASDNCDADVTIVYNGENRIDGICLDSYTLTRTWTATDNCDNSTTVTQTITVEDTQDPTWDQTMPADVTVECDAVPAVPASITASDNCDADVTVTFTETRADGACADSYTLTRTWTAVDNCGNDIEHVQVITVEDTEAPTFNFVPADVTVECDAIPAVGTPTASDNCDADVTIVYNGENRIDGICLDSYTLTRSWTATDNCDNSTTVTQTITVEDTQDPTWDQTMPADVTVECDAVPAVPTNITASDNCDADVSVTFTEVRADGACADSYTLTRTWTAVDNCGNDIEHVQVITVEDTEAPTFNFVPADVTVECDAIPTVGTPTAVDNCDADVTIVYNGENRIDGICLDSYTLTRSWTATDNCDNSTTVTQTITVQDIQDPTWDQTMPADVTVECDAVPAVPASITASDNCDADVTVTFTETRTDGACADTYTLTRKWVATDNCSNSITHVQTINVQDTEAPVLPPAPADLNLTCLSAIPQAQPLTAQDNCAGPITATAVEVDNGGAGCAGDPLIITRTWTFTDNCGNTSSIEQTITVDPEPIVIDEELSSFACGTEISCFGAEDGSIDLTVTGGCAPYTYNWSNGATAQTVNNLGAGTYSVTVTDANGCTAEATFELTQPDRLVLTTNSPLYECDYNVSCNGATDSYIDLEVQGGCAPFTYTWSTGSTDQDLNNLGAGIYSVTVVDANGCTIVGNYTLTEPDVLVSTGNVSEYNCGTNVSCNGAADGSIDMTTTGGCAPYNYNWSNGATTEDLSGLTAGTYAVTVTDANGCETTASFTLTEPTPVVASGTTSSYECGTGVSCNGAADGSIDVTVSGGCAPYTYTWSNQATTQDLSGLTAGIYSVTIADANGCTEVLTFTITEPDVLTATASLSSYECGTGVSCNGAADGSIDVTVAGGCAPYNYNWSNGATTEDLSGLTAGTYSVTITDENGCEIIETYEITEPDALTATASLSSYECGTGVSCNGAADGSIDVTVAGGCAPYTFSWSNGATTEDLSGLTAGTYSVTITDENGCEIVETYEITEPDVLTATASLSSYECGTGVSCNGAADGSIDVTVAGGCAPYTFSWSNGATTEDLSGLTAGTYSVTITDENGCAIVETYEITEPDALTATASLSSYECGTGVSCNGAADGSIDVTVAGGCAPYTFSWSNGATTEDLSGLTAGTYSVTITDENGCEIIETYEITEPDVLTATASLSSYECGTGVSCNGAADGSIDVTVSGGCAPYSFSWSNGATTEDLSGLTAGTYSVTITDENGCAIVETYEITEPDALTATASLSSYECGAGVSCNGAADGSIDVTVAGGCAPYTYSWSNGATTEDLSGLTAGTYSVTITDENGCAIAETYEITEPAPLAANGTLSAYNCGYNVSCNGAADGSINLDPSGGCAPYSFNWSNGATTEDLSGLTAGTYSVTITDENGCALVETYTIDAPDVPTITVEAFTFNCGYNTSCADARDGYIDLFVDGDCGPFSYQWSNGQTSQDATGLGAGTYTVTITDANGCTYTATETIVAAPALEVAADISEFECGFNVPCNGATNGTIDLTVDGGCPPYSYTWSHGPTSPSVGGLGAGTYTVTITDDNQCTIIDTFTITEPDPLMASGSVSSYACGANVSCDGADDGSIDLTVTGGCAPYTYTWDDGATTEDRTGLTAGTYEVVVKDANGCETTLSYTLTAPTPISLSTALSSYNCGANVSCVGAVDGTVDLTVTGGCAPYTYTWSNGAVTEDLSGLAAGTYTVTVTDANGCEAVTSVTLTEPAPLDATGVVSTYDCGTNVSCNGATDGSINITTRGGCAPYTYNWSTGDVTEDVTGLGAGTYILIITDANGCETTLTFTLTEPDPVVTSGTLTTYNCGTNVSCAGAADGAIDMTTTGGCLPYTYTWSNGATTEDVSGLTAGTYTVTVTDANGCSDEATFTLTEPTPVVASGTTQDVSCQGGNDGSIDVSVSGGCAPYGFTWSNGATAEDLNGLSAGTYDVTITDANGCATSLSFTITEPAGLSIAAATQDVSCNGGNDGSIDVTVTGGTAPYTYNWDNGATTEDLSGITAGAYSVTVTDANGCTITASYTITEPTALTATNVTTDVTCNGGFDGSIAITTSGGTPGYTYSWSTGATTSTINGMSAGTYTVTVTDANGCTISKSFTVNEPAALTATGATTNITCASANDGAIDLTVTGGTSPYSFNWSNGATTEDISNLSPGNYSVTVTDDNGCSATASFTITQPAPITASGVTTAVSCNGGNDGAIDLTVAGGTAPYNYLWSNTATTEDLSGIAAGSYSVTVQDDNGCQVVRSFTISEPPALNLSATTVDASCPDNADGSADLSVSGGTPPYTYAWSNGATTQDLNNVIPGSYTVTVTDANGCTETLAVTIGADNGLSITADITNVDCFGAGNGVINLTVLDGSGIYSFIWSNGATTQNLNGLTGGTYSVTVTDDVTGCQTTGTFNVEEPAEALAISLDLVTSPTCELEDGSIEVTVSGGTAPYTFNWVGPNGYTSADEDIFNIGEGFYTLTVTDANGCTEVLDVTVTCVEDPTEDDQPIVIYDVITPNNDGVNDSWVIDNFSAERYPDNEVVIFNRWGDEVYRAAPYDNEWIGQLLETGRIVPDGTYFYILKLNESTEPFVNQKQVHQGYIVIQR